MSGPGPTNSPRAGVVLLPVRCPDCARSDEQAVVLLVADGPGVRYVQIAGEDVESADVCGTCPKCGRLWCVRNLLRPAA